MSKRVCATEHSRSTDVASSSEKVEDVLVCGEVRASTLKKTSRGSPKIFTGRGPDGSLKLARVFSLWRNGHLDGQPDHRADVAWHPGLVDATCVLHAHLSCRIEVRLDGEGLCLLRQGTRKDKLPSMHELCLGRHNEHPATGAGPWESYPW